MPYVKSYYFRLKAIEFFDSERSRCYQISNGSANHTVRFYCSVQQTQFFEGYLVNMISTYLLLVQVAIELLMHFESLTQRIRLG